MTNLQTSRGVNLYARLVHFSRPSAVIEFHDVTVPLSVSEVLEGFRIEDSGGDLYEGRAVVRSCVDTGSAIVCEVALDESSWVEPSPGSPDFSRDGLGEQFRRFLVDKQDISRVLPDYKLVIADMHGFFTALKSWFDRMELDLQLLHPEDSGAMGDNVVTTLEDSVLPCIDALFERFESVADSLSPEQHPGHRSYMRRLLHPLMLCAPFAHRTFHKPLGYAGDYEMVNLMFSQSPQGSSLYSKMLNAWFVRQPPAEAHRNRIDYLVRLLSGATLAAASEGRHARFLSLGCGPAIEVQRLLSSGLPRSLPDITLQDFNQQTLDYARQCITKVNGTGSNGARITYECKSVIQILKEAGVVKSRRGKQRQFDVVYCAGLFDYLVTAACQQLSEALYEMVSPGGLLVLTNVNVTNPLRHGMDHLLDWNLIYRTVPEMLKLIPSNAPPGEGRALVDPTGVNVLLEVRKPVHE